MPKFKKLMHKALGYYNQTVILGAQLIVKDPDTSLGERTQFRFLNKEYNLVKLHIIWNYWLYFKNCINFNWQIQLKWTNLYKMLETD